MDNWVQFRALSPGRRWASVGLLWQALFLLGLIGALPWLIAAPFSPLWLLGLLFIPWLSWSLGQLLTIGYSQRLAYRVGALIWGLSLMAGGAAMGPLWLPGMILGSVLPLAALGVERTVLSLGLHQRWHWPWRPIPAVSEAALKQPVVIPKKAPESASEPLIAERPGPEDLDRLGLVGKINRRILQQHYQEGLQRLNQARRSRQLKQVAFQRERRALELSYRKLDTALIRVKAKRKQRRKRGSQQASQPRATQQNMEAMQQQLMTLERQRQTLQQRLRKQQMGTAKLSVGLADFGAHMRDFTWVSVFGDAMNLGSCLGCIGFVAIFWFGILFINFTGYGFDLEGLGISALIFGILVGIFFVLFVLIPNLFAFMLHLIRYDPPISLELSDTGAELRAELRDLRIQQLQLRQAIRKKSRPEQGLGGALVWRWLWGVNIALFLLQLSLIMVWD